MSGCVEKLKRAIFIVCVAIGTAATVEGASVTLVWNPNPESNIQGYILSYGTSSGQYTSSVPVGNTTSHTLNNLFTGQAYYFVLQAVNSSGSSVYSSEVSTTLASPLTVMNLTADRPSPQPVGTTITFSTTASGGTPPYQYKWWIISGTTQTVGSNWSANSSFAWTPTVANPSYTIRVWARNAASTTDAPDNPAATLEMNFAITSGSPNTAPTVNAGANRSITLPSNTTLTATVTDDGQPTPPALTLNWTRASGPGTVTFSAATSATTTASFSAAGTYVLRLTASDGALSASDDVTVTVAAAPVGNTAPTVNAGADRSITLPSNTTLTATVSDDGQPTPPALTLNWTRVSGPGTVTFSAATSATTTASFSAAGTYVLRLTASDGALTTSDDVTVTVAPVGNTAPTVNAGADRSITLPSNTTLTATVTDDGQPTPPALTLNWTRVSGPGTVTFSAATSATTTASFSAAGTYVLRLTASDGVLSTSDDVTVTVAAAPVGNTAPTVNAGADRSITLPSNTTLTATVSDDGQPTPPALTLNWTRVSGPGTVTFSAATSATTTASFSAAGTYVLRLTASDGALTTSDDVTVTVAPAPVVNTAPTVNAGADRSITLPNNTTFTATVSDDGQPSPPGALTLNWTRVSGPGTVTFSATTSATTTASFSAAGTYVLRLTASDGALTTSDDVTVTVAPAPVINTAPTVNAGADQSMTLPSNTTLTATVSDDGQPTPPGALTLNWTRVSGPGTVTFSAPTSATTTASFSAVGVYVLRLTVSDGALSRTDDVSITVNGPPVAGSLVGAWGFNEGAGTTLGDSSGNGHTGAVTGATWVTGKYGTALNFNGNDLVTLDDLDLTGSFTVMTWMRTRSLHSGGCASLVMKARDYGFEICQGRLYAGVGTGSNWTAYPSVALTSADLNVWKHVALTYDGTTLRFYIGGTLVRTAAGTHVTSNNPLLFGRWNTNSEYWNGRIDEVRIYNRVLSQAEVQTNMNTPIGN